MKKQLLIVTPNPTSWRSLACVLEWEEYETRIVRVGGGSAGECTDLILIDMDGWAANGAKGLNGLTGERRLTPIIALGDPRSAAAHGLTNQVQVLMDKPVDVPLLLHVIETLLTETEEERALRCGSPDFGPVYLSGADQAEDPWTADAAA